MHTSTTRNCLALFHCLLEVRGLCVLNGFYLLHRQHSQSSYVSLRQCSSISCILFFFWLGIYLFLCYSLMAQTLPDRPIYHGEQQANQIKGNNQIRSDCTGKRKKRHQYKLKPKQIAQHPHRQRTCVPTPTAVCMCVCEREFLCLNGGVAWMSPSAEAARFHLPSLTLSVSLSLSLSGRSIKWKLKVLSVNLGLPYRTVPSQSTHTLSCPALSYPHILWLSI